MAAASLGFPAKDLKKEDIFFTFFLCRFYFSAHFHAIGETRVTRKKDKRRQTQEAAYVCCVDKTREALKLKPNLRKISGFIR